MHKDIFAQLFPRKRRLFRTTTLPIPIPKIKGHAIKPDPYEVNRETIGYRRISKYKKITLDVVHRFFSVLVSISTVAAVKFKTIGNLGNMTTTTFVRSTNDYSISLHELLSNVSGEKLTSSSAIIHLTNVGFEKLEEIEQKVMEFTKSLDLSLVKKADVEFDDNADTPDNYSVYMQNMSVFRTEIPNEYLAIEFLGCKEMICVTIVSTEHDVRKKITAFIKSLKEIYCLKKKEKPKQFYTISQSQHGFELEPLEIKNGYEDAGILDNYNEDFTSAHNVIMDAISSEARGLMLLHGIPGSGKTSYIKHLITKGNERKIVYIPTHLTAAIASPHFIHFVKDQLTNSVLVIEDAESVLKSRDSGQAINEAVSNILNMTDGILADALNLLIICTFNEKIDFLDKALMRKGRLLLEYKFEKLTVDKTDALAHKLFGKSIGKEMALCDIYGLDYELIKVEEKPKVRFGFSPNE